MKKIIFEGYSKEISNEELKKDFFDVDFDGDIMIRFEKKDSEFISVNGVDGYGRNIANEIKGKKAKIK